MHKTTLLIAASLCLLFTDTWGQSTLDFDAFQYRYVGPTRGGRSTTVTGVAAQPNVYYMGSTGGGLWKTTDYGNSWQNVSDGYFATPSIGAVRVAQNDPNIVYVGTGTDGIRSNVITGKGMYKSVDAGKSWEHLGLKNSGQIGAVEIHPSNHNVVFVAAIGQAFQANPERGIFRTQDGGTSWEKVFFLSDTTGFVDLEFMPSNPDIVYAAAWRVERKPWTIISGGAENGIYKSLDGGDTWQKTGRGLPKLMGKIDLAVTPANPSLLYALVEAPGQEGGLYRSENQGKSFQQVSRKYELMHRPFYFCNVDVDPQNPELVYVNGIGLFKSNNGGKSWTTLQTPHGDQHDIWINPDNPQLMVQANDGGANVSHNGGQTWTHQFNQPTAELYQVEVDEQYPYWLYAGQQDNYSALAVPSLPPHSHQLGASGLIMDVGGCETGPAVPRPDKPHIVYANCKGRFSVYNKLTGQEQRYDVGAANMYGHNPKDLKFRFQRVSPIHISPHDPSVVYHTSQFVHKSTDDGKTWEIISPDLTAFEKDKQVISGSPITRDITGEEFYSTIYAIRESKVQPGVIWVGANDGPVHVTANAGEKWKEVTPSGLAQGGRVDCVEPSLHQAEKAYISVLRYQLGDWKPYIFKTTNLGRSWTLLTDGKNGIPADHPVRVVREDPNREGLLYAGTEFGLYVSFDDGKNWQAFQQNLPISPITDLKIHRQDLVLSTMGRGFWILDNVSTLSQELEQELSEKARLFRPQDTYRYRYGGSRGISRKDGSPRYPKPSVIIDYQLREEIAGPVKISIRNAEGALIRSLGKEKFDSDEESERDMATEEVRYSVNASVANTPGLHRFHWDMRHAGPWDSVQARSFQNGPYVAPGIYTVVLSVGEERWEQSFELKADPRVLAQGISQEDMESQEALALEIVDFLSEVKQVAAKAEPELKAKLVQAKGRYTQPQFVAQIQYLLAVVSRADQLPGKDAYDRLEELKGQWEEMKPE
jgi:photosystem II stability/assembly factor-like uncharacterized protein